MVDEGCPRQVLSPSVLLIRRTSVQNAASTDTPEASSAALPIEGHGSSTIHGHSKASLAGLGLAALGVVFGDIGTSPLYTLKTVLDLAGGKPDPATILGILSLVLWTLMIIGTAQHSSRGRTDEAERLQGQHERCHLLCRSFDRDPPRRRPGLAALAGSDFTPRSSGTRPTWATFFACRRIRTVELGRQVAI